MRQFRVAAVVAFLAVAGAAQAKGTKKADPVTPDAVHSAEFVERKGQPGRSLLIKTQILLDRVRVSPGLIDGRGGENLDKAIAAFKRQKGLADNSKLDPDTWSKLKEASPDPVLVEYTITESDVKGPFQKIPSKLEEQAELDQLHYASLTELLAEKFHMSEDLLRSLNQGRKLDEVGSAIIVANVGDAPPAGEASRMAHGKKQSRKNEVKQEAKGNREDATGSVLPASISGQAIPKVAKVEVDKKRRELRALAEDGTMVARYPASIGSAEKPAPSGETKVTGVARNPTYTYNPKYQFKEVKSKERFTIKPGPNNPVGLVWIALTGEGYGIHGTPEPRNVGKTFSHGCVRLTNWDALELASLIDKGTPVFFLECDSPAIAAEWPRRL